MKKIGFKVSARAARLIGRENVTNAEGAIIELVKNAYDADAKICVLFFDNNSLHIIDNGDGMDDTIIENHWMTIGTNRKEKDYETDSGRIRTGAKGIGRFALDRLGEKCELNTKPKNSKFGYTWLVNWEDFESNSGKTIGEIEASLDRKSFDLESTISSFLPQRWQKKIFKSKNSFTHGTAIKIKSLRDTWDKASLERLYKNLGILIPPKEEKDFSIYLISSKYAESFGEIETGVCDDYDYKVVAEANKNQQVSITITRNEQDLKALDKDLFKRPGMKNFPYDQKTFLGKTFTLKKSISELIPGFKESDKNNILSTIGAFSFTFYFMKKQTTADDRARFFYRSFDAHLRDKWLDEYVNIKIFRDGFRVRPYGETRGNSADWLNLGSRAAASPAGVAKSSGGFRVRDYNLSGIVEISRIGNLEFKDKSSREGIQENQSFDVFKQILIGIITEFENDRSHVARELAGLYESKNPEEELAKEAEEVKSKRRRNRGSKGNKTEADQDAETLAAYSEQQKEKIDELVNELKILRVLASHGAMISSFSHELNGMKNQLNSRTRTIKNLIAPFIETSAAKKLPDFKNPYIFIGDMEKQDAKLIHWMQFALGGIRKDKRKRRKLNFYKYLKSFEDLWHQHLQERQVTIKVKGADSIELKAFEIDFDSIFNNLIINSLDAFQRKGAPTTRDILISFKKIKEGLQITYRDSGPGLSKDIKDPEQIFDIYFSTKRDPNSGEQIGTGIGMFLVKRIVEEYHGDIAISSTRPGFETCITIPLAA